MNTGDTDPAAAARTGSGAARGGWLRWLGVAGLCLAIWGGLALVWPLWEKHRAYEIVAEHFEWDETEKTATLREESKGTSPRALRELDRRTARALRVLGTKRLDVSSCRGITSIAALRDITTLEDVSLCFCKGLTSVEGLPAGVRKLNLIFCTGLTSVEGVPAGVLTLTLGGCTGLRSLAGLPAEVQTLELTQCTGLTSVADLPVGLQTLYINDCMALTGVGALPPGLEHVNLDNTPKLPEAVKAEIRALVEKNCREVIE